MTREELEKKHPDYEGFCNGVEVFLRSYFGGRCTGRGITF